MTKLLVFDVETTGLLSATNEPYITQLGFILYDTDTCQAVTTYSQYIRLPDGVEVPPVVVSLTGITTALCRTQGVPIVEALAAFNDAYRNCDQVVAHNFSFDHGMMSLEMMRHAWSLMAYDDTCYPLAFVENAKPMVCTMKDGIEVCSLWRMGRSKKPYKKWPKLDELHAKLVGYAPGGMHDALTDTKACLNCYMVQRDLPAPFLLQAC